MRFRSHNVDSFPPLTGQDLPGGGAVSVSIVGVSNSTSLQGQATVSRGDWSFDASSLVSGYYNVTVTFSDNSTLLSELVVDDVAPTVTIASAGTNNGQTTLSGIVTDPSISSGFFNTADGDLLVASTFGQVNVTVSGSSLTNPVTVTATLTPTANGTTWSVNLPSPLADGIYTVAVNAVDNAGNSGSVMETTSIIGPASQLAFDPSTPGSASAGNTVTVKVDVEDQSGSLETTDNNDNVTLAITGPGPSSPASPMTVQAVDGVATFTLSLDEEGSYTLQATSGTLTQASTSLTVNAATPATKLALESSTPSSVTAGNTFTVKVDVEDQFGNLETADNSDNVTLAITGPGPSSPTSPITVQAVGGVATFTVTLDTEGSYTLKATSGTLTPASSRLTVNPVATASQLAFEPSTPSSVNAGTAVTVKVDVEDQFGNLETADNSDNVTLAITGPGTSSPASPITVQAVGGVATFTMTFDTEGSYTLKATSGTLTPASTNLTVNAAIARHPTGFRAVDSQQRQCRHGGYGQGRRRRPVRQPGNGRQ